MAQGGSPEHMRMMRARRTYTRSDPLARLLAQTERRKPSDGRPVGCLIYTGKSTKNGYPSVSVGKHERLYGHRLVYERLNGPIPPETPRVHHECEECLCLEATHLEAVSATGHAHRHGLGLGPCGACGHEDFYTRPDTGCRQCRECRRRRRAVL